jgi:hypothetical protein
LSLPDAIAVAALRVVSAQVTASAVCLAFQYAAILLNVSAILVAASDAALLS